MKYLATNAVDLNGLLIALKNFLSANGWTVLADGTGGGGLALELTNANGHSFKFGSTTQSKFNYTLGGNFNDRFLNIYYQNADIGMAAGYTSEEARSNDMNGPFLNVWFFTDEGATYCHVMLQTANSRFNHFSFGDLDNKGLHAADIPYAAGLYWQYWRDQENYSNTAGNGNPFNYPQASSHFVGLFGEGTNAQLNFNNNALRVGIPDGVLDPTLGFVDGPVESPLVRQTCTRYYDPNDIGVDSTGRLLDYFSGIDNQSHTGGVPIFPLPVVIYDGVGANTYIGEIPTIGLVNMTGLSAGQIVSFAGEDWMVFPLKQVGVLSACKYKASPQPVCNSINYGIAVKKTDAA